jgi:hypothetical protein
VIISPPGASVPAAVVAAQFAALHRAEAPTAARAVSCFAALTAEAMRGPFGHGAQRFSALNADGVPFQWSVSIGPRPGGVRFLVDCGIPGTSISARLADSRDLLARLAADGLLSYDRAALDRALDYLLPDATLLDASLMGVWLGGALLRDGPMPLKVYVNARVGPIAPRYYRFGRCLAAHGRDQAVARLAALVGAVGAHAVPVASAFDLTEHGIGRFKLYFRPLDQAPALLVAAAEALGHPDAGPKLDLLRRTLTRHGDYSDGAVVFSAEFPESGYEGDFKVDVNTALTLASDDEADQRIRVLIAAVGLVDDEYRAMRDVVAGPRMSGGARHLLFVGLALRARETRVNVYLHPCPLAEAEPGGRA